MRSSKLFLTLIALLLVLNACLSLQTPGENPVVGSCGKQAPYLPINQIQASQHRSPYDGKDVFCVQGVVTAVDGSGFFMQSTTPDEDPNTSEAIYVNLLAGVRVKKGDLVVVEEGNIREYNPAGLGENSLTTTSLRTTKVTVVKSNQALPDPIILGEGGRMIPNQIIENDANGNVGRGNALFDPEEDGMDFFESLESMRVQINNPVAITSLNGFNEFVVLADGGKHASGFGEDGVLYLSEDDPNPERILIDDSLISMPLIRMGDVFTEPIVGIVGYDYGNYRIMATDKLVYTPGNTIEELSRDDIPELSNNQISVASLNVLNLSHLEDPSRVKSIASQLTDNLKSPDILILQEIMDDDGRLDSKVTSADENLKALSEAIALAGGAEYLWLDVDPNRNSDGGVKGGNIRTAILFRLDRGLEVLTAPTSDAETAVELNGGQESLVLSHTPGLIWPQNSAFNQSRKPIIAQFRFLGQPFFVIGVHFNSKGSDGPLYGDEQPPNRESERQRVAQAKAVNGFVKDILELNPDARILVAGDMNDFPWSETLATLKGDQLENLFDNAEGAQLFSYIYEGNAQMMDHILVSRQMNEKLVEYAALNINAVLPGKEQLSDHDPIIAIFDFGYYE